MKKVFSAALVEMIIQVYDPVEAELNSAAEPMSTASMAVSWKATIPATPIAAPQPLQDWAVSCSNNHWYSDQWKPRKKIQDRKDNPKATEWKGYFDICGEFLKGTCTRGDGCWWSHDLIAPSHPTMVEDFILSEKFNKAASIYVGIESTRATRDYLPRLPEIRKRLH